MCYSVEFARKNKERLFQNKDVELELGEEICKFCGGAGRLLILDDHKPNTVHEFFCDVCNGNGKTDWITKMFVKRRIFHAADGTVELLRILSKKDLED
jgi:hypothetical protein